jgi:hypothetical protein
MNLLNFTSQFPESVYSHCESKKQEVSMKTSKAIKFLIALTFFTLSIGVKLHANPIALRVPEFFVSELMFDASGEWVLELAAIRFDVWEPVDSVLISTSSGCAKWKNPLFVDTDSYPDYQEVYLLRNDSLDSDLIIHQEGDFVQVTTYYNELHYVDELTYTLVFGNYTGATVRSPKEGESIAYVPDYFEAFSEDNGFPYKVDIYSNLYAIDTTPTIGDPNDTNVSTGRINAKIYNQGSQPFPESVLQLKDERYSTCIRLIRQEDGLYAGDFYACNYYFDKLHPLTDLWIQRRDYWTINPVEFSMEGGDTIPLDIFINGYVDIQIPKIENAILKIYPNPVSENCFYYETALPLKSGAGMIEIIGLNGQPVGQYPVFENKGKITLPSNSTAGIYTVHLIINKKNYAATKIIVQ